MNTYQVYEKILHLIVSEPNRGQQQADTEKPQTKGVKHNVYELTCDFP